MEVENYRDICTKAVRTALANVGRQQHGAKQRRFKTNGNGFMPNNALSKWRQSELGSIEEIVSDSPKEV